MDDEVDRQLQLYLIDRRRFLGWAAVQRSRACSPRAAYPAAARRPPAQERPASLPPVGGDLNLYVWEGYDVPDPTSRSGSSPKTSSST